MNRRTRAQALVEFALVLPLLLAVMLGIVDGAFLFQGYLTVAHAANEAARFAVVYRPTQGECLNRDAGGGPVLELWPYCPTNYAEDPSESESHYYDRRVELIKLGALDATTGLRTTTECKTLDCIQDHYDEPGMLGVRVWGFQSFETSEEEDMPGKPGLPVRVEVIHNVPLVVYGSFLPGAMVRVRASADMINEGIQVGFGNQAPPTFSPPVPPVPPGPGEPPPDPGDDPEEPPDEPPPPTPLPVYQVALSPKAATNLLPDEREHALTAHVTDDQARDVAGARLTFLTDEGSFQMSGSGGPSTIETTGADGLARAVIYANEPVTASIRAFLDYNMNGIPDGGEPIDTASKVWRISGPYLVVSDHNPEPEAWLGVSVMDHAPGQNPYSLWWCPADGDAAQVKARLTQPTLTVDSGGDAPDVSIQVPTDVAGNYRIESHQGDGGADGCASSGTLVAYSALIEIADVAPDLVIEDVTFVDEENIIPGEPITLTITVTNQSPAPVETGPFDLDTYLDLDAEPQPSQLGETKEWLADLGAHESTVITAVVTVYTVEDHELWLQVDTTGYVDEGDTGGEDNNVYGPVAIPIVDCIPLPAYSDDFNGGGGASWQSHNYGAAGGSYNTNGGQLNVTSAGDSIWSGNNEYYFIYQHLTGDFDARLRILSVPSINNTSAKIGLHVAESVSNGSTRFAMNLATRRQNPAAEQASYRDVWGGTPSFASNSNYDQIPLPSWLRVKRIGNEYTFYRSSASDPEDGDWISQGSTTMNTSLEYVGIAQASYDSRQATGRVDDFKVCRPTSMQNVEPPTDDIHPPGLIQCTELIQVPGFEGNPSTVFSYWKAGDSNGLVGAYQRTSAEFYRGSFSLRLHASNSVIPCAQNQLQPYLYQTVQMPTEVYSQSTLIVSGHYLVSGSAFECSLPNSPDADDTLQVSLRQTDGSQITAPQAILTGSDADGRWHSAETPLQGGLGNPADYAGQTLQLRWSASNDTDTSGTFFYIDDVSAQLCTAWAAPADEPGASTIGGSVSTRGENNVPTAMPGADVWAYTQGSDVLHTRAIHDGTYHFYNVQPGTYVIYAEAWVGGSLRTVSTSVDVEAGDRLTNINLLLQ